LSKTTRSSLLSTKKMYKLSLTFKLVKMRMKINKMEELCSRSSPNWSLKLLKTSDRFVLAIKVLSSITKRMCSIELSKGLWLKEVTRLIRMELEVRAYMEKSLLMNRFGSHIRIKAFCQWRMQDLILTDRNSSFFLDQLLI